MNQPTKLADLKQIKVIYQTGDLIIEPTTPDDHGYFLESGSVDIYSGKEDKETVLNSNTKLKAILTLKGPAIINCLSILSKKRLQKYVVSKTETTVFMFSIDEIKDGVYSSHPFLNAILETNLERSINHFQTLS